MKFSFNMRKFKYGSISTVFVALFVAVVVLVNILAGFLTDRFSLKIDMTESGIYSLTEDTKEFLSSLDEEITIYILSTRASMEKNAVMSGTLELISRYNTESGGKVKYEFIDPNKNPAFFEKYTKARNAKARALVIESPKRYIVIESDKFAYTIGQNNTSKIYYQGEELLTSAILYVASPEVSGAGFVTGHGEERPVAFYNIFKGNNFDPVNVDLLSKSIPEGINNLVISAPMTDFSAEEIAVLDAYMKTPGNNLYVLWSIKTPELPVLERYLSEWGISFAPYVVCDEKSAFTSPVYVVPELASSDIVDEDTQGQLLIVAPRTCPVNILWQERDYTAVTPLLVTGKESYAKLISADNPISVLTRESHDEPGPFTVGTVSQRRLGSSLDAGVSRVVAFGTDEIASEEVLGISRAFNNYLLSEVVEYTNPNTLTMQIMPKAEPNYDLFISQGQAKMLRNVLIFVIPLVIIAAGIFVFMRRRNK